MVSFARGGVSEESRLVIADSGSTDSTHRILCGLKEEYPQLEVLSNTGKQHGCKVIALYNYAIEKKADYIFQTDSDGQTNADEFITFWRIRKEYDGVFGYRNNREDGKSRIFVEKVVCLLLRVFFGVKVPDANAPFRLMRTYIVRKYLYKLKPDYSLPNIMMTVYFIYYNERCIFKPITFRPRQGGKNSIDMLKIVRIGWKSLWDFRGFKKEM